MTRGAPMLPQFVRDLLASPPRRGQGLNLWFYRVARVLHPYRDSAEIIELLKAATAGEPVKHGEIERAVTKRGDSVEAGPDAAKRNSSCSMAKSEFRTARSRNRIRLWACRSMGNLTRAV